MNNQKLKSIIEYFYQRETNTPDEVFLRQPYGDQWRELSYAQAGQEARRIAAFMAAQGLQPGDHIGLLSKNCYHWILADLAIMMGGYVSVPYYASLTTSQLSEVIPLSDIKLLFIGRLDTWADKASAIPDNVNVIKFPHYDGSAEINVGEDWADIVAQYAPLENAAKPDLDDLWTIKFTSGTTGTPKGVMHTHRTPSATMRGEEESDWIGVQHLDESRYFSFLPLNHVAERMGVEIPAIYFGGSIAFAENLDTFANNLRSARPTMLFAVPRIWTKFYSGVTAQIPAKRINLLLKLPIVSNIIKAKILNSLGLQDIRIAVTGAAITPAYIKKFFRKLGIHLIEAYGMTEVCGSITNSPASDAPLDSVGQAIPGAEIKIDPDTQELLMKTPYMMTGYYKDSEKSAEAVIDGWMRSGDRGTIDENGYVRIIGRVGDAFKTAKGSFITPNAMEEELANNNYIEQVCVVGIGLTQPLALVNLSELGQATDKAEVGQSLKQSLQTLNSTRAKFEHISTCVVISELWTDQNNFLTPTLKVKRSEIDDSYKEHYQSWQSDPESIVWN